MPTAFPLSADPFSSSSAAAALAPESNPLGDSDARLKTFNAKQDELSSKIDTVRADTAARNDKLEVFFDQNKPPVYKPPAPYKAPESSSALEVWGSLAMGFAMLASHFTRTPMMTAMNAGAEVMKAFKQKDVDAATQAYQQWKDANTQALDMAKYQQAAYANLMATVERREKNNVDLSKDQMADVRAQMTALASAFKDETMLKLGEAHDFNAQKLEFDRRQHEMDMIQHQTDMLNQGWAKIQGVVDGNNAEKEAKDSQPYKDAIASGDTMGAFKLLAEANPDKYMAKYTEEKGKADKYEESAAHQAAMQFDQYLNSPEGQAASPDERMKKEAQIYGSFKSQGGARLLPPLTDENKHWQAQALASYEMPVPGQLQIAREQGWDGPDGAIAEAQKINPNFNPAKYKAVSAARQKLTSGKDADAIASYVRLDQHLDFFKGLVDKLSDGADVKTLNSIAALWGKQTGNPNVTSYETALSLVGDEIVKAATGAGVAGALGDREEIKKNFDPSLSKDQLRANVNAVQVLVGGAMTSTINKYRNLLTPQEITDAIGSREVMEHFHVDPDTGRPRVEGAYDFGGQKYKVGPNGVEAGAAPAAPQGGKGPAGATRSATLADGRKAWLVGGKWVDDSGKPVQ
jgi:hypothetical protein